ncbi:CapA family protein [Gymnodinialimonas ulvae]|uniref:CapA family protein n=1 Tax=Gymnodinialimonas ulvae TaxID=3126504 RepID=UPI0030B794FA
MGLSNQSRSFRTALKAMALLSLVSCTPTGPSGNSCARPDLAFGGDVLLHSLIQRDAATRPEGFAPAFAPIAAALARAEVAVVNLEGPAARNISLANRQIADPGTIYDGRAYTGYPRFNYHPLIARALRNASVDVVQTANNHALDRGALGVDLTLQALAEAGLPATGTIARGTDPIWHVTRQISGRNVAFVACTFSTNNLTNGRSQVLDCYGNRPSIPNLIQTLTNTPTIDAVILLPHWGTEYAARPNARQRRLAQAAAEAGATAIVGAHPHVLQPIETLTTRDGRQVPVAYSLGNLISSQWSLPRRTGAILYLDLARDEAGRTIATNTRYLPTRVERFAGHGVAVSPAALLPDGGASVAHARGVLGPRAVGPDGCLTD